MKPPFPRPTLLFRIRSPYCRVLTLGVTQPAETRAPKGITVLKLFKAVARVVKQTSVGVVKRPSTETISTNIRNSETDTSRFDSRQTQS